MILHKNNTFYLQGKTYSYVMRVNEWGYLEHLHFGAPVGEDDLGYLAAARELSFAPVPPDAKIFSLDTSPQEYAGYGQGDFRTPSAMYTRSDGGIASRFRYAGYALGGELPPRRGGANCSQSIWRTPARRSALRYSTPSLMRCSCAGRRSKRGSVYR